jgi:hypothetical protein
MSKKALMFSSGLIVYVYDLQVKNNVQIHKPSTHKCSDS